MNIPQFVKIRRVSVSKEKLIAAIPVDVRFKTTDLDVDIYEYSLKNRLSKLPYVDIEVNKFGITSFLFTKENYVKLELWLSKKECKDKPKPQKITLHKMTIEDKLFNLMMGVGEYEA